MSRCRVGVPAMGLATSLAVGMALVAAMGGCETGLRPGAQSILEAFQTDLPPGELAAMALDPYDANRRYVGTLGLANQSFASQPIYVRLFADNATDADPLVRAAALRGLAIHGRSEHAGILVAALRDADEGVRLEAARALQRIHEPLAIDPLLTAMREPETRRPDRPTTSRPVGEPSERVRAEAADALGQYAQPKVLQGLITGLDDADLGVNLAALRSLRTLTGQDFGVDRSAWAAWARDTREPFAGQGVYVFPVFNRERRLYERVPLIPQPPNEVANTPTGLPRS